VIERALEFSLTLEVLLAGLAFAHALCGRLVDARDAITLERRTNR
jgi:hypothetical protein